MIPKNAQDFFKKKGYAIYRDELHYYISKYIRKSGKYAPVNGDLRLSYFYIPNQIFLSVIGQQSQGYIIPYKNNIFLVQEGNKTPEELIALIPQESYTKLYFTRFFCSFGIFSGLYFAFK